jgi:hypothetical protein
MDRTTDRMRPPTSKSELEEFCACFGYDVEQLAAELNVSRATIFNWKNDPRGLPRLVSLALHALRIDSASRKIQARDETFPKKHYRRASHGSE